MKPGSSLEMRLSPPITDLQVEISEVVMQDANGFNAEQERQAFDDAKSITALRELGLRLSMMS